MGGVFASHSGFEAGAVTGHEPIFDSCGRDFAKNAKEQ